MRSRWLIVLMIVFSFFAGCLSVSEQMEQGSHCGVRKLDSFVGIPFGAQFPEGCDVESYTTNKWDKTAWDFVNNRKIIDAGQIRNTVRLHEGKVYEVTVSLQRDTDKSYETAKRIDKESKPSYSFSGAACKMVGDQVKIEGTARPSLGGVTSIMIDSDRNWTSRMFPKLIEIIEKKYGKSAVRCNDNKYVIPFEDGRSVTVENCYLSLHIRATDAQRKAEKELQKENRFIKGVDAL